MDEATAETIVVCRTCNGTGIDIRPFQQVMDRGCATCGGFGYIDLSCVCANCGRPGISLIEDIEVCSRGGCHTEVKQAIEQKRSGFHFHGGAY